MSLSRSWSFNFELILFGLSLGFSALVTSAQPVFFLQLGFEPEVPSKGPMHETKQKLTGGFLRESVRLGKKRACRGRGKDPTNFFNDFRILFEGSFVR